MRKRQRQGALSCQHTLGYNGRLAAIADHRHPAGATRSMATLTRKSDGRVFLLGGTNTVGRNPGNDLSIPDPLVSGLHARIAFRRGVWSLDDLNSRNGTLVNGDPLRRDTPRTLSVGDELTFGVQQETWTVTGLDAPTLFARSTDGAIVEGDDLLVLPDEEQPVVSVYQRADGRWVAERTGDVSEVENGAAIALDGTTWRLHIPSTVSETMENIEFTPGADELSLHFAVSTDEEHVELEARLGGRRYDLKSRAHHYLLLTLARARVSDAEDPELPATAHGWLYQDDLASMLRLDDNAVYLAVFRARKQLKSAGVARAASLIERRPGTRQIRLGIGDIHIRVI